MLNRALEFFIVKYPSTLECFSSCRLTWLNFICLFFLTTYALNKVQAKCQPEKYELFIENTSPWQIEVSSSFHNQFTQISGKKKGTACLDYESFITKVKRNHQVGGAFSVDTPLKINTKNHFFIRFDGTVIHNSIEHKPPKFIYVKPSPDLERDSWSIWDWLDFKN